MTDNPLAKAQLIREKRTIEATRKNIMGGSGKLGMIAKCFGSEIIKQGSGTYDQTFLERFDDFEEEETVPVMEDESISKEGYFFDGLSRGMHFEIKYLNSGVLTAYHLGYLVYHEISGELFTYVPNDNWEKLIVEPLYQQAKLKAETMKKEQKEFSEMNNLRKAQQFIINLRNRWGF